ncbi:MAG: hypothetical protein WA924_16995 [Burkholderiaceae bacterium]
MNQLELPMKHPAFQPYLGNFRRVRKALAGAIKAVQEWTQLPLKLHLRKLYKIPKVGFIWTRPDGKQFRCRNMRQLVARIMDYDGHLLNGVLRLI